MMLMAALHVGQGSPDVHMKVEFTATSALVTVLMPALHYCLQNLGDLETSPSFLYIEWKMITKNTSPKESFSMFLLWMSLSPVELHKLNTPSQITSFSL